MGAMLRAQETGLRADFEGLTLRIGEQRSRLMDMDNSFTHTCSGVESLRASVSSLDTQLKARALEWESFSEVMKDRIGSLQAGISENKWGVVTIAGAISTIAKPSPPSPLLELQA